MKAITGTFPSFDFEINRRTFHVQIKGVFEAQHGEFPGMPLPHYVYKVVVTRRGIEEVTPLNIEYHGSFEEWARGKPYMPPFRALHIFADFVIDAGLSITRKPEDLIRAWEYDTDMANKTWRMFETRREALKQNFRMTTDDILSIGNAFHVLMVNGRLAELLDTKKGSGRNE